VQVSQPKSPRDVLDRAEPGGNRRAASSQQRTVLLLYSGTAENSVMRSHKMTIHIPKAIAFFSKPLFAELLFGAFLP